ncbi:hypothetical protein SPRG_21571, partial [Saprolegnia parasitica CBS 223.65]
TTVPASPGATPAVALAKCDECLLVGTDQLDSGRSRLPGPHVGRDDGLVHVASARCYACLRHQELAAFHGHGRIQESVGPGLCATSPPHLLSGAAHERPSTPL